jgi:hypothetical protein
MGEITLTTKVNTEEFWLNVVGSGFETWSWWTGWVFDRGYSWEVPGAILVDAIDPDTGEVLAIDHRVTLYDMAQAYSHLVSNGYRLVWDDLDASGADCIIQQCVFGEVVFG